METTSPPHSIEAEQSVLGGLMLDPSAWNRVESRVLASDFYRREHRLIYEAIVQLVFHDQPIDVVTVSESLRAQGSLSKVGDLAYLGRLAEETPSAANITAYADIVREKAQRRHVIATAHNMAQAAYGNEPLDEVVSSGQVELEQSSVRGSGYRSSHEVLDATAASVKERRANGGRIVGLTTGLPTLDARLGGIHGGRLYILAGRPSLGKSAMGIQISVRAGSNNLRTGRIDVEMDYDEIGARMASNRFGLSFSGIVRGDDETCREMGDRLHTDNLRQYPMWVDADTDDVSGICARISEWHRRHNIEAVVVDHLQDIKVPGETQRYLKLGEAARRLKKLAKRLHIPVILVCQLAREVEKEGRRPRLSDLRESGDIEQAADVVIALSGGLEPEPDGCRIIDVGLLKNRQGKVGWLKSDSVRFNGVTQSFHELAESVA